MKTIKIGTRGSKLALWQAYHISNLLNENGFSTEIVIIQTTGDTIQDRSLSKIGSKGVFTAELEEALRNGSIDLAIHSAKDMQSSLSEDLPILAFTKREAAHDVIVSYNSQFSIQDNVILGTSSVRRIAFLKHYYPNVQVKDMRGNLQTRLNKLKNGDCDGLVLAYAGVHRMQYDELIVKELSISSFVPPVGQGCIAVQIVTSLNNEVKQSIKKILNDIDTEVCVSSERVFLKILEGGCSIPSFCYSTLDKDEIIMHGGLVATDGSHIIQHTVRSKIENAEKLAVELAVYVLDNGGRELLQQLNIRQ